MSASRKGRLLRLGAGLLCWLPCAVVLYAFVKPQPRPPREDTFYVCVVQDGQPAILLLELWRERRLPLCRVPLDVWEGYEHIAFKPLEDGSFYLRSSNDSMSDPWEFAYTAADNEIVPLWFRYGSNGRRMMAILYSIPAAVIVFRLLRWVRRRRHKSRKT